MFYIFKLDLVLIIYVDLYFFLFLGKIIFWFMLNYVVNVDEVDCVID